VLFGRWRHIKPIALQTPVNLVDLLLALLGEADVKSSWIPHFGLIANLHARQSEHHSVVIRQQGDIFVSTHSVEPKVFLEEFAGHEDVRHSEIQVVQIHDDNLRRLIVI
jgi:hypothetical protein